MGETIVLNGEEIDLDAFLDSTVPDQPDVPEVKQPSVDELAAEIASLKSQLAKSSQQDPTDDDEEMTSRKQGDDFKSEITKTNRQLFVMQQRFDNEKFQMMNADKYPGFVVDEQKVLSDALLGVNPEKSRAAQLRSHIQNVASIAKMIQEGKYKVEPSANTPVKGRESLPEDLKDFDPGLMKDSKGLLHKFFGKPKEAAEYFEKARRYQELVK